MSRGPLKLKSVFSKERTFRPKKRFDPGTTKFDLHKKAQASLKSGLDLKSIVVLPPGEELNDWIAVHVVDFFNRINLIYGTVLEFCTNESCPVMSGGPRYEYRWQDSNNEKYKKPTNVTAGTYVHELMAWIENIVNDENIFPVKVGVPFPRSFQNTCKKILTRLHRVFVHVYIHHFDRVQSMGAEAHINACYKHFFYFVNHFKLVDKRELEPLKEMQGKICR